MSAPLRILLIEDDRDYAVLLRLHLDACMGKDAYSLDEAQTLAAALERLARPYDVVLLDLMLPDSAGLQTVDAVRARAPRVPVVVLTNHSSSEQALAAIARGAQDYIVKESADLRQLDRTMRFARERARQAARVEGILRASLDGIVVAGPDRRVRYANPAAAELLGVPPPELAGREFLLPLEEGAREVSLAGPGNLVVELRVTAIDWDGEDARLVFLRDLTELRRVEQLKADLEQRRVFDAQKDRFLETVSHEMRSPLTVVHAVLQALLEDDFASPEERRGFLEMAHKNCDRMLRKTVGLLDLARLESGLAAVEARRFGLAELIEEARREAALGLRGTGLRVSTQVSGGLPEALADPDMVSQVLRNLLDNARRFARSRVVLRSRPSEPGAPELVVEVENDGPPIPPERLERLFSRFQLASTPSAPGAHGYKGTGLGLNICRDILSLNGGRIWAENLPGGGVRFSFALPAAPAPAGVAP